MKPSENEKTLDRLIFFSDAVVAISLTLLVIPLTDKVIEATKFDKTDSIFQILQQNTATFFAFGLSFIVIIKFWFSHKKVFSLARITDGFTNIVNAIWLLGIVLIPFASELISGLSPRENTITYAIVLLLNTMCLRIISSHFKNNLDQLGDQDNEFIHKSKLIGNATKKYMKENSITKKSLVHNRLNMSDIVKDDPELIDAWNSVEPVMNGWGMPTSIMVVILVSLFVPSSSQACFLLMLLVSPVELIAAKLRLHLHHKRHNINN